MPRTTITGGRELSRALDRLIRAAGGGAMRTAVAAGADVIEEEAKTLTESDSVRRDIETRISNTATEASADVGVQEGSDVLHIARFQEFGTRRMSARPFLRPAFDARKDAAASAIEEKLRAAVNSAAAGKE